jgi:uncharacterized protein YgbK (DUF1537 family)
LRILREGGEAGTPEKLRRLVLADDLTGAFDTGVKFAAGGLRTSVQIQDLGRRSAEPWPEVLAYSTDSRMLPPAEAYRRTRAAARLFGSEGIFKKVDSSLRGNLGAEIDAVLDLMPSHGALLCPALPSQRRAVVEGRLLVDGVPVSQTQVAGDPVSPVRQSHIPTLLAEQSQRTVGTIGLACVAAGPADVSDRMSALLQAGATVVVADAVDESDLDCLVKACIRAQHPLVLCGSAGLAGALVAERPGALPDLLAAGERVVAVVGSLNPVAITQADLLHREAGWPALKLELAAAVAGGRVWERWLQRTRMQVADSAVRVQGIVITVAQNAHNAQNPIAGRGAGAVARVLAERLAEVAQVAIDGIGAGGALLTGGDTAAAVLRHLRAQSVELSCELDPGVPLGRLRGGPYDGLAVATKAGGFGDPDVLRRVAWRMSR